MFCIAKAHSADVANQCGHVRLSFLKNKEFSCFLGRPSWTVSGSSSTSMTAAAAQATDVVEGDGSMADVSRSSRGKPNTTWELLSDVVVDGDVGGTMH